MNKLKTAKIYALATLDVAKGIMKNPRFWLVLSLAGGSLAVGEAVYGNSFRNGEQEYMQTRTEILQKYDYGENKDIFIQQRTEEVNLLYTTGQITEFEATNMTEALQAKTENAYLSFYATDEDLKTFNELKNENTSDLAGEICFDIIAPVALFTAVAIAKTDYKFVGPIYEDALKERKKNEVMKETFHFAR